jgi:DNA (cytosine-5)-methyltransferase 1
MDRSTAAFTSQGCAYDGFNSQSPQLTEGQASGPFDLKGPRSDIYRNDERLVTSVNDNIGKLVISDNDEDDDEPMIIKVQPVPKPTVVVDARTSKYGEPLVLNPGCDVELEDHSFLRITETTTSSSSRRYIRGHRLLLQNHYELLMPERHHELVQLVKVDNDLNVEAYLWTIPAELAIRNCRIIYTNQQYKQLNYRKDVQASGCDEDEKPIYFCRYTSADTNVGVDDRKPTSPPVAGRIEHLRSHQAESGELIAKDGQHIQFQIPDAEARRQWRGEANCTLGGSHVEHLYGSQKQKYTFGDAFAGAGGTSWGAHTAGLKMKFAFDQDPWAVKTYKHNLGLTGMQILQMNVHDFVRKAVLEDKDLAETCLVDFLHLSPPCQPFCGANRRPNMADNAKNLSAFARVADLLEICKPRFATLEESKSLTDVDKRNYFKSLISFFIKKGYSVQWKALDLERWGVPQTRKRLIIIASG